MKSKRIASIFLVGLLFGSMAWADNASLRTSTKALPQKATVGDELRLIIQVERPKAFETSAPLPPLDLGLFEVKKIEAIPGQSAANRVRDTFILTVTTFEMGDLTIPPVAISYKDGQARAGKVLSDAVPVKIISVGKKPTDKDDIRGIKGPVTLSLRMLYNLILALLDLGLIIFLIVKIILRRKRKALEDLESKKPAHERLYLELARLRDKHHLENAKTKEFYSEFSDILRRYLERRFKAPAFEHTTAEILRILKDKDLEVKNLEKIKEILEISDLVKFAKFIPSQFQAGTLDKSLIEMVEMTKIVEETTKK